LCYSEVPGVFEVYTSAPGAPLPFLLPLLPLCRAAAPLLATVPRYPRPPCLSWPPRLAPELAHRLNPFLLAFPERATLLRRLTEPPTCHRRPPPLTTAVALLAPAPALVAPMRRPQAGHCPSSSPLGFFRACHAAPPLPELCLAATTHAVNRQQLLPLAVPSPGLEACSRMLLDFFYPSRTRCCLLLPLFDCFHRTSAAAPVHRGQLGPPLFEPCHHL
jgi:hypothetical protein